MINYIITPIKRVAYFKDNCLYIGQYFRKWKSKFLQELFQEIFINDVYQPAHAVGNEHKTNIGILQAIFFLSARPKSFMFKINNRRSVRTTTDLFLLFFINRSRGLTIFTKSFLLISSYPPTPSASWTFRHAILRLP